MKSLIQYRNIPTLLAGIALSLNCLVLGGCNWLFLGTTVFGKSLDRFPAIVLNTQNPGSHDYMFNWDTATVGGFPAAEHQPDAKYWRLNLFYVKDGTLVGPLKACKSFADRTESFTGLEFNKLMRADLDVGDDPNCENNAKTYSVLVLLHDNE